MEIDVRESGDGATFRVRVAPRASRDRIGGVHAGALKVALTAPPVDGAANSALIALLAKALGAPKSALEVVRGRTSKDKTVLARGVSASAVRALARG